MMSSRRKRPNAAASLSNPAIVSWESLMWTYQVPTPGEKWVAMQHIFVLASQA
jgi:L-rhamnose mutarotase